jgi:hypothetical protein
MYTVGLGFVNPLKDNLCRMNCFQTNKVFNFMAGSVPGAVKTLGGKKVAEL